MAPKIAGIPYSQEVPCNLEIEQVVLSTVFHDQDDDKLDRLDIEDFVDYLHRLMLCVFKGMKSQGIPFEIQSLHETLKNPIYEHEKKMCGVRPEESLARAADIVLSEFINPANFEYYFRVLRSDRMRRFIMRSTDKVRDRALNKAHDPLDTIRWSIEQSKKAILISKLEVEV